MRRKPATQAAVAVILAPGKTAAWDVLFIRRAKHPRDPWSGHIGLPGGRREPVDRSLLETVIREVQEETRIRLRRSSFLHSLKTVRPLSRSLPPISIRPYVFRLSGKPSVRRSSEVAGYFWTPLPQLGANERLVQIRLRGRAFKTPAYCIGRRVVWGLTHRILNLFLEVPSMRD